MRLAVFTNRFPAPVSTFFARDMRGLLEAGWDIDVFPFYPVDAEYWSQVPSVLSATVLPRERVHHSAPRELARVLMPYPFRDWIDFARDTAPIVAAAARYGVGPAAKTAYAAAFAWEWSRRHPIPVYDHILAYWGNYAATSAYLFHRSTHPGVPFSMFAHARVDLYRHQAWLAEKFVYADNIFLVCEYNRRYVAERFPEAFPHIADKIQIHHLGLPLDEIPYGRLGRSSRTLVAVGRLEPLKGYANLIRAVAQLRGHGAPIEVQIVGTGEDESSLRELAGTLGVASQVTFLGLLPPDETMAVVRRAGLFVHPSVAPDAMPTVVKEALAVGTPVIASNLAGIPEILDEGRCGLLVPPGDVAALAAAIETLLGDEALQEEFSRLGRERVELMFDMWRNGAALADRLRATTRGTRMEFADVG